MLNLPCKIKVAKNSYFFLFPKIKSSSILMLTKVDKIYLNIYRPIKIPLKTYQLN